MNEEAGIYKQDGQWRSGCCDAPIFRVYPDLAIWGCHRCGKPVDTSNAAPDGKPDPTPERPQPGSEAQER